MIVLKSEDIKYKNKTIIKETTDRKKPKFLYSIIGNKYKVFYSLSEAKKYIDEIREA